MGENSLDAFTIALDRDQIASEHVILERCIELLEPVESSRLGLVLPDGLFNNQGEISNCPRVRRMLARRGVIEAIISLPDYAFRKSGAQNKTSILIFRRYTSYEEAQFTGLIERFMADGSDEDGAIQEALEAMPYRIFLAEANSVGYTSTGASTHINDLYRGEEGGRLASDQAATILGEYRRFQQSPDTYNGYHGPDCIAMDAATVWSAHPSHRLDPKYHLFKHEELAAIPAGWVRRHVADIMRRREEVVKPEQTPEAAVQVITISQTGEIRPREAGKGRNPPEWLGMYFEDSPSTWYRAYRGDVIYSSIDLWKGCVSVVPLHMDRALVTKEFPIYEVTEPELDPAFLSILLRTRYYQRAFRAITTGHSNRRRTQTDDFEGLEIAFPPTRDEQMRLVSRIVDARMSQRAAGEQLKAEMLLFSDLIDGRGAEELPEVAADGEISSDEGV